MCKSHIVKGGGVCLFIALSMACSRPGKVDAKTEPAPSITVGVVKAAREDLSRSLVLAAEFRPYQEIEVHAKVAGFVKEIYVDVGDRVKKGQVLAVLEIPELVDELNQVKSAEKKSELDVMRAQGDLQRSQSAHTVSHLSYTRLASVIKLRPNLVAQQEIDNASAKDREDEAQMAAGKASLGAAEEAVRTAQANEQRVESLLAYAKITAPFPGVITKRYADTGGLIQSGISSQTQTQPVVRLSQNDRLRLVLPVPETIVARIHLGAPVQVKVSALNRTFEGVVARFSRRVDESTRTMDTEVDVANPNLLLMPGMYAYATLTMDRKTDALAVPIQAVAMTGKKATVFVVNSRKAIEEREVRLGIETPDRVEVLSGLKADELVVIGSRNELKPGQQVEPKLIEAASLAGNS